MDTRLENLETKIAYQEDTIEALNEVVCRQQKKLDELETICKYLLNRAKSSHELDGQPSNGDEKPPHY
ncbi:MAG: SlyX family protein [Gammaproteobacteria bacterium]|nr:SlyX family protein [Gammaproteobacteria bacterium]